MRVTACNAGYLSTLRGNNGKANIYRWDGMYPAIARITRRLQTPAQLLFVAPTRARPPSSMGHGWNGSLLGPTSRGHCAPRLFSSYKTSGEVKFKGEVKL